MPQANEKDIHTVDELQEAIGQAAAAQDLEALDALQDYFVESDQPGEIPFAPAIALDDAKLDVTKTTAESTFAIELANSLDRAKRTAGYYAKLRTGYKGPIIVSEGDSWFQYPFFLTDVIDNINDEYAVLSLGGAGHLLADMVLAQAEYKAAIRKENADFFLLSGGGNDMVANERLKEFVFPFQTGMTAEELLDRPAFAVFRQTMRNLYDQVLRELTQEFPNLTILFHGYDYARPRENGPWLGKALEGRNVPAGLQADVIALMIDEFNEELKSLESRYPGRAFHIDCRHQVGSHGNSWYDELHPKNAGYKRVADRFLERIRAVRNAGILPQPAAVIAPTPSHELRPVVRRSLSPGTPEVAQSFMMRSAPRTLDEMLIPEATEAVILPAALDTPVVPAAQPVTPPAEGELDSSVDPCSSLAAWQAWFDEEDREAYNHFLELWPRRHEPDSDARLAARRELSGVRTLERIINESNLFPINFLARGQRAARTVGRVSVVSRYGISVGTGTGFLVAPGLLLTNHHVLNDIANVANSYVLFDYEFDVNNALRQTERFSLSPELFFTDADHDFTLVSVASVGSNGSSIEEYGWLPLIRQSGKAIKKEPVSILQHPGGAPKQIAMRDSRIIGRKAHYIYYTTDTNPGSSGAPVVNDDWLPVALHHRSVPDYQAPCRYVANRGVRISSIMAHLDAKASEGNELARRALELLDIPLKFADRNGSGVSVVDDMTAREGLKEPYHDVAYESRTGYNEDFLGVRVPLPTVRDLKLVAQMKGTDRHVIPYEHFSVAIHRTRRLALFTAANLDARSEKKEPEPGFTYTRHGLSGLGKGTSEKWFKDPRVPGEAQLPDRFFTKDNRAFDKGHVVRRFDVAWGNSFEQVRRANGDTYHTTNCTPQVKGFNRANLRGLWGKLENLILAQADTEQLSVFAGPILDPADQSFRGVDDGGEILVQIPAKYWKIVIARSGNHVQSFAFLLEQDLSHVPLEFQVDATWQQRMISIAALEVLVRYFTFPKVIHAADQAGQAHGELVRCAESMELFV